jgi:AcrR family transcriptional regulator
VGDITAGNDRSQPVDAETLNLERRPRNRRGEGTRLRADLIDAATALVTETGNGRQLSLRAVAKRVGIATTSVYPHFADVEQLKVAVVQRGFTDFAAYRSAASQSLDDPAAALLARCRAYGRFGVDHPGHYRLMFGPDLPATLTYESPDAPGRRALEGLADSIRQSQQAGATGNHDDPFRLAVLVWSALHGLVSLRIDRPDFPWPTSTDQAIDDTVRKLTGLPGPD